MSQQYIEIAGIEVAMTSPYLDQTRSVRKTVQDLTAAREIELAKTTSADQRQRVVRELSFLHNELARIGSQGCSEWQR